MSSMLDVIRLLPQPQSLSLTLPHWAPALILAALLTTALAACGGDSGDATGQPANEGGPTVTTSAVDTPTTNAQMQDGAELTTEEYVEAMEEISTLGDDEIETAFGDFLFNGSVSQDEAERIRSLEASDSWSDDDAEFASEYAETLLQTVTGLYDLVVRVFNEILDEMSRLRPPEHLSDLHSNYIAATGEVVQLLQMQLETVKNADTEVKSREELADFQAVVTFLDSGPVDPALQQKIEELTARGDAACLALKGPVETELGREVNFCDAQESAETSAEPAHSAETDREALIAFYNATDGPNWTNNDNWLSDAPLGEWYGVETYPDGRVATLELSENGLRGEIPAELAQLSILRELSAFGNGLSGEIPVELGQLSNLNYLYLEENDLSGEIPPELAQLPSLYGLSLWGNSLSGEIPPELGQLLVWILLDDNDLSGEIPPELGQLTRLQQLTLADNNLAGEIPVELGQLSDLEVLYLRGNEFSGCVPGALRDVQENDFEELGLPLC